VKSRRAWVIYLRLLPRASGIILSSQGFGYKFSNPQCYRSIEEKKRERDEDNS